MTTTLRPTAPERRTADGHRARTYDVCVNSRPVGSVEITTDRRFGPRYGRIERLAIAGPDRRRGRGTVAALAAEEVLRGWGCRQIAVTVPAGEEAALGLVRALGYAERSRSMEKTLGTAPPLPGGVTVRELGAAEFPAWEADAKAGYAQDWAENGLPEAVARAKADRDHATALPAGPDTPGTVLRALTSGGQDVGTLWVALKEDAGFVFLVKVGAAHRGRGHGRTLMRLAERECLAAGARTLGLHVFAANTPAVRLYDSLGYWPTAFHFYKPL
ncbi:N-acetyltransferase [Streptomyces mashuensis]|uniref:N-acetyltransferase n=1 Tax=Streptomyces mashuensis TaxID=33904 RepID=A0A919ECW3_9ACTN|nr:GNAT family N-acetyltransferase [Streptomyces mashuensis]GHF39567.1 N-acetyltransferase [Streptomyces mashuensis]